MVVHTALHATAPQTRRSPSFTTCYVSPFSAAPHFWLHTVFDGTPLLAAPHWIFVPALDLGVAVGITIVWFLTAPYPLLTTSASCFLGPQPCHLRCQVEQHPLPHLPLSFRRLVRCVFWGGGGECIKGGGDCIRGERHICIKGGNRRCQRRMCISGRVLRHRSSIMSPSPCPLTTREQRIGSQPCMPSTILLDPSHLSQSPDKLPHPCLS